MIDCVDLNRFSKTIECTSCLEKTKIKFLSIKYETSSASSSSSSSSSSLI